MNCPSVSAESVEVAGGKTGTQPPGPYNIPVAQMAARITDGNTDATFGATGSCTLVNRMVKPWITIDLGKTYYVTDVTIFTRGFVPAGDIAFLKKLFIHRKFTVLPVV